MAVVAAIRPNPFGVSSYSRAPRPRSSVSGRPDGDVAGLAVELDPGAAAGALGAVVRDEQRLLDRLDQQVEGDLLLPLEPAQRAHVDVHQPPPRPRRRRRRCRSSARSARLNST